jgi:hypothetical protein
MDGTVVRLSQHPNFAARPPVPVVRPDGIEWDRQQIRQTAKRIEILDARCNAVETHIAKGAEFAGLHQKLAKNKASDKAHIGWKRAFEPEENKFGLSRKHADGFITIHTAFARRGNAFPPSRLPQSFRALLALARLLAREEREIEQLLDNWINDGSIGPTTTEAEVKALARQAGLLGEKKPTPPKQPEPPTNPFDVAAQQATPEQFVAWIQDNEARIVGALSAKQRARIRPLGPRPTIMPEPLTQLSELLSKALDNYCKDKRETAADCFNAFARKYADSNFAQLILSGTTRRE